MSRNKNNIIIIGFLFSIHISPALGGSEISENIEGLVKHFDKNCDMYAGIYYYDTVGRDSGFLYRGFSGFDFRKNAMTPPVTPSWDFGCAGTCMEALVDAKVEYYETKIGEEYEDNLSLMQMNDINKFGYSKSYLVEKPGYYRFYLDDAENPNCRAFSENSEEAVTRKGIPNSKCIAFEELGSEIEFRSKIEAIVFTNIIENRIEDDGSILVEHAGVVREIDSKRKISEAINFRVEIKKDASRYVRGFRKYNCDNKNPRIIPELSIIFGDEPKSN